VKRIVIFLASSIEDLREDRLILGDYFYGLNNLYHGSGIEFELIKCEYCDDILATTGKQFEYDEKIRQSDLCFFLVFHRVGKYTLHEFDVAWESFQTHKHPQIITYFKNVKDGEVIEDSVVDFMTMLQESLGHYPGRYDHVDTVKLSMLMKINRLTLNSADITIRNGEVFVNGEAIAQSKNIPLLNGNLTLRNLLDKKQICERNVMAARSARDADPSEENDDLLYEARRKLADVSKELTNTEKEMLAFASTVEEMTSDGRVLTHRQKTALAYYEAGEYRQAKQCLESKERDNELDRAKLRFASGQESVQGYVEETLLWIRAEMANGITQSGVSKIKDGYEKILKLVDEYHLCPDVLYDYATFLMKQNQYPEAIAVAQKLNWYYAKPDGSVREDLKAQLLDLLGVLYRDTNQPREAERMHREALDIWEALSAQNEAAYTVQLALSYNGMGELYHDLKHYDKAEAWYCRALRIWEHLAETVGNAYDANLAGNYNNLGLLYMSMGRSSDAEARFLSAIRIRERLAIADPDLYEPDLAKVYNNLGLLYAKEEKLESAETMYHAALRIRERLAGVNPEAYEPNVGKIYHNLGNLYVKMDQPDEAEKKYRSALEIRARLASKKPELYMTELASSHRSMGSLYELKKQYREAEESYRAALRIYESLAKLNPDTYEPNLAFALYSMGKFYRQMGRWGEAKEALLGALQLYGLYEERNSGYHVRDMDAVKQELALLYSM
jgi:tetratricopeptide (TPR) repeat protein